MVTAIPQQGAGALRGPCAIWDVPTTSAGQRGNPGSSSPEPPTTRAQTVWTSCQSSPNILNNHQARFLLAPAVASGCPETNTTQFAVRVILEARDQLHPLQRCCQRPSSDPQTSPSPAWGWVSLPGAGCPLPHVPVPGDRLWPPLSYQGTGKWCHLPPSPSLCQTSPTQEDECPGMKAHMETRGWHPEPVSPPWCQLWGGSLATPGRF